MRHGKALHRVLSHWSLVISRRQAMSLLMTRLSPTDARLAPRPRPPQMHAGLAAAYQAVSGAVHEQLRGTPRAVVVATHGHGVGAGAEGRQQVAPLERRQAAVLREAVARLAHRADRVVALRARD